MQHPRTGDLLIKGKPNSGEFLIADALTHRVLSGPFPSFTEAAAAAGAHAQKIGVSVWQENSDNRGRPLPHVLLNFQNK